MSIVSYIELGLEYFFKIVEIPYFLDATWAFSALGVLLPHWRQQKAPLLIRLVTFLCLTIGGPNLSAVFLLKVPPFLTDVDSVAPYLVCFFMYNRWPHFFSRYIVEDGPLSHVVDFGQAIGTVLTIVFLGVASAVEHPNPEVAKNPLAALILGVLSTAGGSVLLLFLGWLPSFNKASTPKEFIIGSFVLTLFYYLLIDPHQLTTFPIDQEYAIIATCLLYFIGCDKILRTCLSAQPFVRNLFKLPYAQ